MVRIESTRPSASQPTVAAIRPERRRSVLPPDAAKRFPNHTAPAGAPTVGNSRGPAASHGNRCTTARSSTPAVTRAARPGARKRQAKPTSWKAWSTPDIASLESLSRLKESSATSAPAESPSAMRI